MTDGKVNRYIYTAIVGQQKSTFEKSCIILWHTDTQGSYAVCYSWKSMEFNFQFLKVMFCWFWIITILAGATLLRRIVIIQNTQNSWISYISLPHFPETGLFTTQPTTQRGSNINLYKRQQDFHYTTSDTRGSNINWFSWNRTFHYTTSHTIGSNINLYKS